VIKRAFDVVVSALGLIVFSPVWLLIAVAIKLEDGGPVLFRQTRTGRGGREFTALKFRSMVPDAERGIGAIQAGAGDIRVTRVGRVIRSMAMDELPQLWNIFIGDMSIVGPRPLRPGEIEARGDGALVSLSDIPGHAKRHSVRPGLTGLAQVYAPRDLPRTGKFRLDRIYLARQSFWLDLRLIVLSFWITIRGRWEDRGPKL